MELACTAKRFRKNMCEAFFEFTVWRRFSVKDKGPAWCGESPRVWSCDSKTKLLKHLMADLLVVRIQVRRNYFWWPMFRATSYTKHYYRRAWNDPHYNKLDKKGHVPPLKEMELF